MLARKRRGSHGPFKSWSEEPDRKEWEATGAGTAVGWFRPRGMGRCSQDVPRAPVTGYGVRG